MSKLTDDEQRWLGGFRELLRSPSLTWGEYRLYSGAIYALERCLASKPVGMTCEQHDTWLYLSKKMDVYGELLSLDEHAEFIRLNTIYHVSILQQEARLRQEAQVAAPGRYVPLSRR